jgi:hypothetical protein
MTPREKELGLERDYWKSRVQNAEYTAETAMADAASERARADSIQGERLEKYIEACEQLYQLSVLLDKDA